LKITQTGVGASSHEGIVRDTQGTSLLPVQAEGDGVTMFRLMGRAHPAAPWMELKAPGTADWLESVSWVPYLQLEVTSGAGTVNLYIAEK
jgi:hypothetical protein